MLANRIHARKKNVMDGVGSVDSYVWRCAKKCLDLFLSITLVFPLFAYGFDFDRLLEYNG